MMILTTPTQRLERSDAAEAGRLADLYARHSPAAGRLAYLLTGDVHLAEDLTQEAFVRAFGRFRDLRQPESFEWYLRRTLVNLTRSYFRRQRTEREHLARYPASEKTEPGTDTVSERDAMWRALQQLPPKQRTALVLRFYEDLADVQVAATMRCPVGTAKSLIHRGLERLRREVPKS
jgi:RNA polymerase sigma-70 factor (sigma-E family)